MLRRSARLGVLIESFEIRWRALVQRSCEPVIGPAATDYGHLDPNLAVPAEIWLTALPTAVPVAACPRTGTPPVLVPWTAVPACRSPMPCAAGRSGFCVPPSSALLSCEGLSCESRSCDLLPSFGLLSCGLPICDRWSSVLQSCALRSCDLQSYALLFCDRWSSVLQSCALLSGEPRP